MSAGICLPPQITEKFKQALVSGKINPEKLASMTSEARHKLFSEIVGEGNSKFVNAQFESKMLLKDQQRGYLTWAKKLTGIAPETKRDLISRIERMDKFLEPAEEKIFLKDLASTRLGLDVTAQEAKKIATYSQKLQELETRRLADGSFSSENARMKYGYAKYDMGEYLSSLKNRAERPTAKESILHPIETTARGAGLAKSVKAALDNSAIFRQGWKTLWTNPIIWQKNARASFTNLAKVGILNKDVVRETMADILSRPNYDKYAKMKLAIGNIEEAYPTSLPAKIPIAGRAFKASEQAYEAFLYKTRADVADKLLGVAQKTGVDINDKKQLADIGKLINSLTGRGHLGRFENGQAAQTFNNIFFSIRFVKSNFDTLTAHQLQHGVTPFARKQAAKNLVKVVMGSAAVLAIADFLKPGSVDWDSTSKDFGKIKIGHTRFDVTGGMGSIAVLASQIARNQEKSTSTGIIKKFGEGYGSKTGIDAINNYFENKLSPATSVVKDLIKRQDFEGNKITAQGEAKSLLLPLPISTQLDAKNDSHSANRLLVSLADGLGISTGTYGGSSKKFNTTMGNSPKLSSFKQAVGADKFKQAEKDYNSSIDNWMSDNQAKLNELPQEDQQITLNAIKTKIQNKVFKDYGFKYKAPKPSGTRKSLLESVK